MTLNRVVLPAPLGPISPVIWPASHSRSTSRTAACPPKRTFAPRTSSMTMSGGFALRARIPSEGREQAVGLRPPFVQVAHQPEP
jgi:hypothetical protein